ncbi:MAG: sigma-70 family RNA polymerase sigma factor [Phycisphaerae bacterium]|nr:sigma-70 family RNA polymerase sigma factor [Phycisphaerae bacterium]
MCADNVNFDETIANWCRAAAAGDDDALEHLLWTHQRRLLGFARRKIGVDWQGKIDADDILQEAYIEIARTIANFEPRGPDSFYHWATRIISNRFIDQVRHWRREKRDATREITARAGSTEAQNSLLARCMAKIPSPSGVMRHEDALAAMQTCIARLPDDYRVVIQRLYINQEPLRDVAAQLDRSEDAVRRLGTRAVERLTHCLGRASRYFSTLG